MKKVIFLLAIIAVLTFALAAYAEDYVKNPEWWTKAGEPYKGVTIKGITESTPPARAIKQIAPIFEKLTGIKVEFELTSWDEMYNKSIQDIQSNAGIYDMIYTEGDISYAYIAQKWITDLTPFVNNPKITEPNLDLPDFLPSFIKIFKDPSGNLFGLPSEAFLKSYVYRKDLFDDPEIQKAFQAKYNKDLKVPATWDEYTDIAKFFTAYGKEKGIELYGHIAQAKTHPCVAYEMCETIWPSWGVYNWGLNLEKMRATVANGGTLNGDTAKKAFAWYIDMLQYAPPGVKTYTWDEVGATFGAGKVAQGV
ncbi:MAG: extracellular solute-binding protein, partial [Atribacterota bacterium]